MARVRVLTMKFPRVTKIGQSIASMRTTPQVSGLGPVTVYHCTFQVPSRARPGPSLPLPTGLGPPESSTGPSPVDTFTLPPFLPSRARPGSSPLDLWQCKRGLWPATVSFCVLRIWRLTPYNWTCSGRQFVRVSVYVYLPVCMSVCVCLCVCMCVCMCVCLPVCVCVWRERERERERERF